MPLLEEALRGIGDDDVVRRIEILNGIASDLYYTDAEREGQLARDAVALAENCPDPAGRATAQLALHRWYTHQPQARRERLDLALTALQSLADSGEPRELQLLIHRSLLSDLIENALVGEFDASLDDYERAATQFGRPRDIYWAMAMRATQATLHGDLVAGEQLGRGAAMRGHELEQSSAGAYILQRFVVRYQQARLAEEVANLRQVGGAGSVFRAGAALVAVACAEVGQMERAAIIARDTLGPDGTALPGDVFWLAAVALFADVGVVTDDRELLELVHSLLTPCADHVVVFGTGGAVLGPGHQWLGQIDAACGRTERALEHFAQAMAISQRIDAPYWLAQAMASSAAGMRERGRPADQREIERLLHGARALAARGGYGRVLAQVDALA